MTSASEGLQQSGGATIAEATPTSRATHWTGGAGRGRGVGNIESANSKESWVVSDDARTALEKCELFQDVTGPHLMEVAALVEETFPQPEEKLLYEGESARYIFVVIEGRGIAHLKLDKGWVSLGLVGPGEVAGWSALIDGQLYPATVKALTPMRVARIETTGLMLLMNLEPEIGYPVHKRLSTIFYRQYQTALRTLQTSL